MIYDWQQEDFVSKLPVYIYVLCFFQSFPKQPLILSILKGHDKYLIKMFLFMLLTEQEVVFYRKRASGMELLIVTHAFSGSCLRKISIVGRFRFKLTSSRTAGIVLRRKMISICGVSPTFPNMLSDSKHQNPLSKRPSFVTILLKKRDNKSLFF